MWKKMEKSSPETGDKKTNKFPFCLSGRLHVEVSIRKRKWATIWQNIFLRQELFIGKINMLNVIQNAMLNVPT